MDTKFVVFGEMMLQQASTTGNPTGTNCASRLVDLFVDSYRAELSKGFLNTSKMRTANISPRALISLI